tara:strand:- start:36 stop:1562 length:1527 start_codon:yes stop_codon:yes gene_type:complete
MSTIKINQLATSAISLTDFILKADSVGLANKSTMQDLSNFLNTVGALAFRGVLLATDASVTQDGIYVAGDSGTYTNNGGLVITVNNQIVLISITGAQTIFEKVEVPVNNAIDAIPTEGSNNATSSNGVFNSLLDKASYSSVNNIVELGQNLVSRASALGAYVTVGSPMTEDTLIESISFRNITSSKAFSIIIIDENLEVVSFTDFSTTTNFNDLRTENILIPKNHYWGLKSAGGVATYEGGGQDLTYYATGSLSVGLQFISLGINGIFDFSYKLASTVTKVQENTNSISSLLEVNPIFKGEIYSCVGDSISKGYSSTGGDTSWCNYLNTKLQSTLEKKATNGASIWLNMRTQVAGVDSLAKLVTIMFGTNDVTPIANGDYTLGNIATVISMVNDEPVDFAISTLYNDSALGRFRWCLEFLIANNPNSKIVIVTPLAWQDEGTGAPNATLEGLRGGQELIANFLKLKAIRMTEKEVYYSPNFNPFLADAVHPNDYGYEIVSGYVLNEII